MIVLSNIIEISSKQIYKEVKIKKKLIDNKLKI